MATQICSSQTIESDWKTPKLKGEVLSCTEVSYVIEEHLGEFKRGERKREYRWDYDIQANFDEKGNLSEENRYNSDGEMINKYTYKYDVNGNVVEKNMYDSHSSIYCRW